MTSPFGYGLPPSSSCHLANPGDQANSIKFINLAPETAKRVSKTSFRLWFAGIVFSLINSALKSKRLAVEAKRLKESRPWGEKDLAEEAARETRLEAVQLYVPSHTISLNSFNRAISARKATKQQLTIDLLDVWIPAAGAELVHVNEGALGLLGYVVLLFDATISTDLRF